MTNSEEKILAKILVEHIQQSDERTLMLQRDLTLINGNLAKLLERSEVTNARLKKVNGTIKEHDDKIHGISTRVNIIETNAHSCNKAQESRDRMFGWIIKGVLGLIITGTGAFVWMSLQHIIGG